MKPEELYQTIQRNLDAIKGSAASRDTISAIEAKVKELYDMYKNSREEARTDTLTQLPNYRGLLEILEREIANVKRYGEPLTLGFIDVNKLKPYNDRYGHIQGNFAIVSIVGAIKRSIRHSDILARYTLGDEFCLVLPRTTEENSKTLFDKVKEALNKLSINAVVSELPDDNYKKISVSVGYTQLEPNENYMTALNRANATMKMAKSQSRRSGDLTVVLHR